MRQAITKFTGLFKNKFATKAILSAAILGAAPVTALAGHYDHHASGRIDIDVRSAPDCPPAVTQVWVPDVYRTVEAREWVPPTYRTITERVWREGGTQCVTERVWLPDRYEIRGHHDRDLIERGHWEDLKRDVYVPGHYEDVSHQELVCDGHWQTVQKQELVSPGHWETRQVIAASPDPEPRVRFDLHLPVRW